MRYGIHAAISSAGLAPSYNKAFIGGKATRVRFGYVVRTKPYTADGTDRYKTAKKLLDESSNLDVGKAFQILEAVKQTNGKWTTCFSMVYLQNENDMYYCLNGEFKNILEHSFI